MNTTLNKNRSLNLFIVVGVAVALIAAILLASPASVNVPAVPQNAGEDQNQIALAPLPADAFPAYRESEWHSSPASIATANGMDVYRLSEHTLTDPRAGIQVYLASERTMRPVNFTVYQLSEWFGK